MSSHSESDDHFIALEPKVEGIETELSDEDGGQGNSSMWIERVSLSFVDFENIFLLFVFGLMM